MEIASWGQEITSNDENINSHMQLSTRSQVSSQAQLTVDAENIVVNEPYEMLSADKADETYREMQSADYITCVYTSNPVTAPVH